MLDLGCSLSQRIFCSFWTEICGNTRGIFQSLCLLLIVQIDGRLKIPVYLKDKAFKPVLYQVVNSPCLFRSAAHLILLFHSITPNSIVLDQQVFYHHYNQFRRSHKNKIVLLAPSFSRYIKHLFWKIHFTRIYLRTGIEFLSLIDPFLSHIPLIN